MADMMRKVEERPSALAIATTLTSRPLPKTNFVPKSLHAVDVSVKCNLSPDEEHRLQYLARAIELLPDVSCFTLGCMIVVGLEAVSPAVAGYGGSSIDVATFDTVWTEQD